MPKTGLANQRASAPPQTTFLMSPDSEMRRSAGWGAGGVEACFDGMKENKDGVQGVPKINARMKNKKLNINNSFSQFLIFEKMMSVQKTAFPIEKASRPERDLVNNRQIKKIKVQKYKAREMCFCPGLKSWATGIKIRAVK